MFRPLFIAAIASMSCIPCAPAQADVTVFFNSSQVATPVDSGVTSETISSNGYLFTYTRDKLFTGGMGVPIGRRERVTWPQGVEAQAVTTPPPGVTDYKARLTISRVDGSVFDLISFRAMLLGNTASTGAEIEIVPMLDGEDGLDDPVTFNVSGYYGMSFFYDESANPWGSTAAWKGFDTYKIGLFVDYAFTSLTLEGDPVPCPSDFNSDGLVDFFDYLDFVDAFSSNMSSADFNADGTIDFFDYLDLVDAFSAGC